MKRRRSSQQILLTSSIVPQSLPTINAVAPTPFCCCSYNSDTEQSPVARTTDSEDATSPPITITATSSENEEDSTIATTTTLTLCEALKQLDDERWAFIEEQKDPITGLYRTYNPCIPDQIQQARSCYKRYGVVCFDVNTSDATERYTKSVSAIAAELKEYDIELDRLDTLLAAQKQRRCPDKLHHGVLGGGEWLPQNGTATVQSHNNSKILYDALSQSPVAWLNRKACYSAFSALRDETALLASIEPFIFVAPCHDSRGLDLSLCKPRDALHLIEGVIKPRKRARYQVTSREPARPRLVENETQGLLVLTGGDCLGLVPGAHVWLDAMRADMTQKAYNAKRTACRATMPKEYRFDKYLERIAVPPHTLIVWSTRLPNKIMPQQQSMPSTGLRMPAQQQQQHPCFLGQKINMFSANSLTTNDRLRRAMSVRCAYRMNDYRLTGDIIYVKRRGRPYRHHRAFVPPPTQLLYTADELTLQLIGFSDYPRTISPTYPIDKKNDPIVGSPPTDTAALDSEDLQTTDLEASPPTLSSSLPRVCFQVASKQEPQEPLGSCWAC